MSQERLMNYYVDMINLVADQQVHRYKEFSDIMVKWNRAPQQSKPALDHLIRWGRVVQYGRGLYGAPGLKVTVKVEKVVKVNNHNNVHICSNCGYGSVEVLEFGGSGI